MSIGYYTIQKIHQLEETASRMGFVLGHSRMRSTDTMAVYPATNSLPLYSRGTELFIGDLDEVEAWLRGVVWMKDYLTMIKLVDDKKIERKEQNIRNEQLVSILKE